MARRPPVIITDMLLALPDTADGAPITVGSPAWYAWLAHASSFAFVCQAGRFTATKESRSPTRAYWKASRHRHGRLYRAYLGTAADLTPERLIATAILLAGEAAAQDGDPTDRQLGPAAVAERHLLESKFRIPPPDPDAVIRPRLMAALDAALVSQQRLIVITAPAGFGKTTLVSTWLARRPNRAGTVAWLSLDDDDDDLGQFLAYLITALERVVPALGTAAWDLFRAAAAQPPIHALVRQLCAALTAHDGPLIVVLDDYHCLLHPAIHDTLRLLLAHQPPQITLQLTSRADPDVFAPDRDSLPVLRAAVRRGAGPPGCARLVGSGRSGQSVRDRARYPARMVSLSPLVPRRAAWLARPNRGQRIPGAGPLMEQRLVCAGGIPA